MVTHGQSSAETRARLVQHVFVVDDEKIIASTLATILQLSGFTARFFVHPREALQAASTDRPDVLISDVMMPELSGIDLAIQVKRILPVAKFCCYPGRRPRLTCCKPHAKKHFALLSKPIHPTELLYPGQ